MATIPSDRADIRAQMEAMHNEFVTRGLIGSIRLEIHYGPDGNGTVKLAAEHQHKLKTMDV